MSKSRDTKKDVKKKAQEMKLDFFECQKESVGACFIIDKNTTGFLKRRLSEKYLKAGPIKTTTGKILTQTHEGLPLYTIGQRRGAKIGGLE